MRPSLPALFAGLGSRGDRDTRCILAVREHGYTMKEVAESLGLHYATVSRILSRGAGRTPGSGMLDFKT
jgi:DNA-directed RNA polymerase specialized sigma24 family protein